tara:strand:- start:25 stop:543 length:519 start_codon:yes stop_codon:yes gene_type:complete
MKIHYTAKCFDTAAEVDNYPWGFRMKTQRRYWVETTKHGDRSVVCTMNPKTGKWCKPKKSTYEAVLVVTEAEDGKLGTAGIGKHCSEERLAAVFDWLEWDKLNDQQKAQVCKINAMNDVMKHVTFTVAARPTDPEERAKKDAEQAEIEGKIAGLINAKTAACMTKNGIGGAA